MIVLESCSGISLMASFSNEFTVTIWATENLIQIDSDVKCVAVNVMNSFS